MSKYMPWVGGVVVTGLTPGKLEELAASLEVKPLDEWEVRVGRDPEMNIKIAARLRKWKETGLPHSVVKDLKTITSPTFSSESVLCYRAYWATKAAERCSHKHEGHLNSVVLRNNWPGRICQVCGEITKKGESVVCGGRRRGEQSNRTGYAHRKCLKHLKIKKGEKVPRRELFVFGGRQYNPATKSYVEVPNQKVIRGAQLKRQQCINTGGTPTHMMWLNQSTLVEAVAFDIKSLKRKEIGR